MADSARDANMRYATGMVLSSPGIFLRVEGRAHLIVPDADLPRARAEARGCRVQSLGQYMNKACQNGIRRPKLADVIRLLLRAHKLRKIRVPESFPLGQAHELERLGISVKPIDPPLFPARELKTPDELKMISAALMMAEVGLAEGLQALKTARIDRSRKLVHHHVPLTSDKLRNIIESAIVQAGGMPGHTSVAAGNHALLPNYHRPGVLKADEPIVLSVSARSRKTGYHGALTRTVVKGRPREAIRKLFATVLAAQELGAGLLRHKTPAHQVHLALQEFFTRQGYRTTRSNGAWSGFAHDAGHGLGLDLCEVPVIGPTSTDRLRNGHVVTLEPGLSYPALGTVRLRDVFQVRMTQPRNLTKFEKALEL